ncbi:MAG: radical SAM protein [Candidatus Heimdallarchaeota archaeon]
MKSELIYINKNSGVPLYGVDFLGIIDRGTNVIELKPLTLCNLRCKYCFVSAGDYKNNFIVDINYLLENVNEIVEIKGRYGIEIHLAPYGEMLLYPNLVELVKKLWEIKGIEIISMQTNGLLLNRDFIKQLEDVGLSRINISLNSLNAEKAGYLCNCKDYKMKTLLNNIENLLHSKIDILLAPVWFPGENDKDIEEIIKFVINLRNKGYSEKKIQIGIQKYLIYKTGRKLKKIRPKTWDFFYKQLSKLEKKYNLKLKLGPKDFNIHKRKRAMEFYYQINDRIKIIIVSVGRWTNEYIGRIDKDRGIKVLVNKPEFQSKNIIGKNIEVKIIKANYKDNILTAIFPI